MLDKNLGIILFAVGLVYILYVFFAHKKSVLTIFAALALLFGAALYQYPEKVNEIIESILKLKS